MPFVNALPEKPEELTIEKVADSVKEASAYLHGLRVTPEDKRDASYQADCRSAISHIESYDAWLTAQERAGRPIMPPSPGPSAATLPQLQGLRSMGAVFADSDEYKAKKGTYSGGFAEHEIRGTLFTNNDLYHYGAVTDEQLRALIDSNSNTTGGAGSLLPQGSPVFPVPRQRRLFLRDLMSVVETTLSSVPYVREYTPLTLELGASSTAEGIAKPEVALAFENDDAPMRKIAAWVPVTTEIIEDIPALQGYINTRLGYMMAVREEQQIVGGSGVSPQIKGILLFSGVQPQSAVSGEPAITLAQAIAKIENVDGDADAIVMNPIDFWAMISTRYANQFDYGFGGSLPYGPLPTNPWGVPVVRTRAMASKKAIVGSFRQGATLFDRMKTVIRVGNQHSDFFVTNRVAILAEERIGLAVHRPDFFVDVTLP